MQILVTWELLATQAQNGGKSDETAGLQKSVWNGILNG